MREKGKVVKPNEMQKALVDAMIYGTGELRISHIPFRMSHLKNCLKKKVSLTLKKGRKKT